MNHEQDIERRLQLAKSARDPRKARILYLEASESCLKLSRENPNRESYYVNEAAALYMKAQSLKPKHLNHLSFHTNKSFKDVGGLEELKQKIKMKIIEPLKNPGIFKYYGRSPGGGILMYGPPGCGKSLIAEATAGEAGIPFFNVRTSDLKSKYVGETEKNIAELFKTARENQPCIIFFDEFEALGQDRMHTNHIGRGFVSQLLNEMDGVGSKDNQILLLAATNAPWLIDTALLRDGRFGDFLFVPPPDQKAREEILKSQLENRPLSGISHQVLAEATIGLSGADIRGLCNDAADQIIQEYFENGEKRRIEYRDFALAMKKQNSSVDQWFVKSVEHIKRQNLKPYYRELMEFWKEMNA